MWPQIPLLRLSGTIMTKWHTSTFYYVGTCLL